MTSGESKKVICVIEDNPEMIKLVTLILQKGDHYEVISAMGGKQGLELISQNPPDLVLLDLMMPDMSGWDVYQEMKGSEALKSIPVIVVTAKAQDIDKVLGIHIAKVDDYITKPFTPSDLTAAVQKVLGSA